MSIKYSGVGTGYFKNGNQINNITFNITLSNHDIIKGSLKFKVLKTVETDAFENQTLTLLGKINEIESTIEIRDIRFSRLTHTCIIPFEEYYMECDFTADEVLLNQYILNSSVKERLLVKFGIMGMYSLNVYSNIYFKNIETEIGEIALFVEDDYKIIENKMREFNRPYTLMKILFFISPAMCLCLRNVIEKSIIVINKFLTLTKFAQGSWHQWTFIEVYNENKDLIFTRRRSVYPRLTHKFDIIQENFYKYITDCYPEISFEYIKRKKLNESIDWYIESVNGDTLEFQIINANTCLELLTDVYIKENGLEFIVEPTTFDTILKPLLKEEVDDILKNKGLNSKKRDKNPII